MTSIPTIRARQLRQNSTDAEKHVWYLLRGKRLNGYKFKRQVPVGQYIVDFICMQEKLIIELDGGQHTHAEIYDQNRTRFLNSKGYRVLRYWNHDVFKETETIVSAILEALENPART